MGQHTRPGHAWRGPVTAATGAAIVVTLLGVAANAAGSGYSPPCTDVESWECTQQRLGALESWAATAGFAHTAPIVTAPPTATSTVTRTLTSTTTTTAMATVTASPKSTATPTPTPAGTSEPVNNKASLPYSAGSFFTSELAGAPVDQRQTTAFRAFMAAHPDQKEVSYPLIRGVGGNRWGTVFAEGAASDPVWTLTGSVPTEVGHLETAGFHAPESLGAQLTGTSDSPFVVLDRASGFSVWAAKAVVVSDHTISVGAAGLFMHDSNGLDRRNPRSDSAVNFRSRGAIPDAMVIRQDLMTKAVASEGDLGHVLHLFFVETDSAAGHVHPMVGHESGKAGWGAAGQRIAVSATADLSGCSPHGLVLARTLQRHGAYLGDNAGGATSLKAQQDHEGTVWGSSLTAHELNGCVDWDDFVVIATGWQ